MWRKKKSISSAKAVILCFCLIVIVTIMIQLWFTLQSQYCEQQEHLSDENSFLNQLWEQSDATGTCLGPSFSSVTLKGKNSSSQTQFQLSMNCTEGGSYSFSFTDNPNIQFDYPGEPVSLSTSTAIVQKEYIRSICPNIPFFPTSKPWTNVYALVSG